jgi:hypothetical protein
MPDRVCACEFARTRILARSPATPVSYTRPKVAPVVAQGVLQGMADRTHVGRVRPWAWGATKEPSTPADGRCAS